LCYSQARNIIERIFGIMKKRFKILTLPRLFKLQAQILVIQAFCVFYNILVNIQEQDPDENPGKEDPNENDKVVDIADNQYRQGYNITRREIQKAEAKKDKITIVI
jgi:hypothetical protein